MELIIDLGARKNKKKAGLFKSLEIANEVSPTGLAMKILQLHTENNYNIRKELANSSWQMEQKQ